MDGILRRALQPVLRDLKRDGLDGPRIEDREWSGDADHPSAMLWSADGWGSGVAVARSATTFERIAAAAEQVQEWAIEGQLWGTAATNWPRCPHHPRNHPLTVSTVHEAAVWICPTSRDVVAPIGGV